MLPGLPGPMSGGADRDSALPVYLLALPYLHIVLEFICPNTLFHTCYHQVDCYICSVLIACHLACTAVKMTAFNAHLTFTKTKQPLDLFITCLIAASTHRHLQITNGGLNETANLP